MTLRVEITEDKILHGRESFTKGDITTHEDGEFFVNLGWAKAVDNSVATGKRTPGAFALDVDNSNLGVSTNG